MINSRRIPRVVRHVPFWLTLNEPYEPPKVSSKPQRLIGRPRYKPTSPSKLIDALNDHGRIPISVKVIIQIFALFIKQLIRCKTWISKFPVLLLKIGTGEPEDKSVTKWTARRSGLRAGFIRWERKNPAGICTTAAGTHSQGADKSKGRRQYG